MSDAANISFPDTAIDTDEELVFDEPEAVAPPVPHVEEPAAKQPRRTPRRGRSSVKEDVAETPTDPVPPDPVETSSAEAVPAAAEEPAGASALDPRPGAVPAGSGSPKWLLAIVALALLSSFVSLGGLMMVGRTLARAQAERDAAESQRDAYARVPDLVARLDAASQRLDAATARAVAISPGGPPATIADIRRELDALKMQLAQRQPQGMEALNGVLHDGLAEIGTKLDRLSEQGGRPVAQRPMMQQPSMQARSQPQTQAQAPRTRSPTYGSD